MTIEKRKVFAIDDEKDILHIYQLILQSQFDVILFNNPLEALAEIEKGNVPAAFITDINMPKMTGIQLVEELRKKGVTKPVIVVTGYADKDKAIQALALGVFAMVEKPCHKDHLRSTVRRAVMTGLQEDLAKDLIERYKHIADNVQDFLHFFKDGFELAEKHFKSQADDSLKQHIDAYLDFSRKKNETEIVLKKLEEDITAAQQQYSELRSLITDKA